MQKFRLKTVKSVSAVAFFTLFLGVFLPMKGTAPVARAYSAPDSAFDYVVEAGSDALIHRNSLMAIPQTGAFSVEAWIYPDRATNDWQAIFAQDQSNAGLSDGRFWFGLAANMQFHVGIGGSTINSTSTLSTGSWKHVAVTVDTSNNIIIYVDGTAFYSSTINNSITRKTGNYGGFSIGTNTTGGHQFDGRIDQAKIWNGVLTAEQVSQSMRVYDSTGITGPTLRAHYSFNDSSSSTLIDKVAGTYTLDITKSGQSNFVTSTYSTMLDLNAKLDSPNSTTWLDRSIDGVNISTTSGATFPEWNSTGRFFRFNTGTQVYKNFSFSNPTTFSIEIWFRTSQSGSKIIGFQNAAGTGTSATAYDRHLYVNTDGKLSFGLYQNSVTTNVTSDAVVNDGAWHHAVATYRGDSAILYLDGVAKAATVNSSSQNYSGYWVIGGGNLNTWEKSTSGGAGWIGDLAVAKIYRTVLSPQQVTDARSAITALSAATPSISSQPQSIAKTAGQSASFSVTASRSDSGTLSYQWQKNGSDIANATSSTYTIPTISTGDAGEYRVVVTNSKDGTTAILNSNSATLTVSSALSITTPSSGLAITWNQPYSLSLSASGGTASKTYSITGTLPTGLSLNVSTGVISGTTTALGNQSITATVTDGNGATATTSNFILSVSCLTNQSLVSSGLILHLDAGSSCSTTGTVGVWRDLSGNNRNVTWSNTPTLTNTNGGFYDFNRNNSHYGTFGSDGLSDFSNGFSISFYARFDATAGGGWERIIDFGNGDNADNIVVAREGSTNRLILEFRRGSAESLECSAEIISDGVWAHYIITVDPSAGCVIYKNATAQTLYVNRPSNPFLPDNVARNNNYIGDSNWTADTFFDGGIGDLAIYNRALTADEVNTNYFAQSQLYTVTYDATTNGGTAISPISVDTPAQVNAALTLPTPASRVGLTQLGWYTAATGGTKVGNAGASYTPTSSITLYFQWTASTYSVTFNANSGAGSMSSQTITHNVSTNLTANSFTRAGYRFSGWNTAANGSGTSYSNSQAVSITEPLTLYAQWTRTTYTVKFENNYDGSSSTLNHFTTETLTLPSLNRTGYTFNGWYTASSGGSRVGGAGDTFSPLTNTDLVLLYEIDNPDSYSGTGIDLTDVASSLNNQVTGSIGTRMFASSTLPTYSMESGGYIDLTSANNNRITQQSSLSSRLGSTNNNISVFAWIYPKSSNGVIVAELGQSTINTGWHDSQIEMVNGKLTFNVWGPSGYATPNIATTSNVTLNKWYYVGFTYNGTTLTAYVFDDTGSAVALSNNNKSVSRQIPPSNNIYYGIGATDSTNMGSGAYGDFRIGSFQVYKSGLSSAAVSNNYQGSCVRFHSSAQNCTGRTLYAQWTAITQTITYAAGTGATGTGPISPTTASYGSTFTIPANTYVRNGYTFAGWSDGTNTYAAGATYPSTGTVSQNVTLTATWSANACSGSPVVGVDGYIIRTITGTGSCVWTTPDGITAIEVLVVAGGGGGGFGNLGGGGGAGEVLVTGSATLSGANVTGTSTISTTPGDSTVVTVGTGGTTGAANNATATDGRTMWNGTTNAGTAGGDGAVTSFGSVTATGGGGGGGSNRISGAQGGSGGGSSNNGSGGSAGGNSPPPGWTSFKNAGSNGAYGSGGGAGSAGSSTKGGSGVTVWGITVAGGGGGWGKFGSAGSANDTVLGGNGRLTTGNWGYMGSAPNYTSPGTPGTGTGGGAGAPGGSGVVVIRYASIVSYTYDANGGSGSAPNGGSKQGGTSFTTAANPFNKSGYVFNGWNTAANGSGTSLTANTSNTMPVSADAIVLYAQWIPDNLTISFNANNGTGTMSNQSVVYSTATAISSNLFARNGYTFAGWNTQADGNGSNYTNGESVTLTQNLALYAKWTANQYTVTYSYNSATGGNGTATSSFTTGGTPITLPTPTRTGYTFAGWYSDAGLTSSVGAAGASYSPTGATLAIDVYAKWTAINYTITYDANSATSGSVPTDSANYNIGQNITVKANSGSLVRTGYTFAGWNTQADGNGTNYASGTQYQVGSENVTLYAKWSANTYTVTYNSNGATGSAQRSGSNVSSDNYTTGNAGLTLPSVGTLGKTGYDFVGWSTTPTGDAISGAYTTTANVTLYAKWTIKTITITFAKGDASTASFISFPNSATTTYGTQYALNQTIDTTVTIGGDSFAFVGWNDGNSLYRSGSSYLIGASDLTLTAIWVRVFGVRYIANGGTFAAGDSAVDSECLGANSVCTDQQGITANSAPTRTGYNFGGWLAQNNESISAGANFTVASNRYLLSAQWTPINYTITYVPNGGSSTPTETTKQIGQNFTVASAISRTGYTFAGWSDGTNNYGAGANYTIGTSDVSLTAQWTPNVYTITYDWNGGRGSAEADASYTVGNSALTLPLVGDRVKDGYEFSGWSTTPAGDLLGLTYTPTESRTLYAIWGTGSYTVAFNAGRGNNANNANSIQVQNGSATTLPLPTRANFVFDGWYDSETGGSKVANHGDTYQPTRSRTLYARWIQSSIYGIPTNARTRIGQSRASNTVGTTFTGANANSAVSVNVPAGALPENTDIFFDLVSDFSRAQSVISNNHDYIVSMAVYWLTPDETVPDTNAGKSIQLTITNSSIKAGASAYAIINNQSVLLGTATQDGTITVSLTSDPEVVIAATKPDAPTNVSATSNGDQQSIISWSAPTSTGGADITGYTATASNGQSCTTSTLTCTITGLSNGTAYTFTVKATNSVGDSDASTSASATTAAVYAVTFDSKGGTSVNNGSFLTNGTVSEPTAPTRSGYTFAGWSDTDGGSAVTFNYTPGVTNDITLYALWTANTYTVTFNSNSGSAVVDGSFTTGGTVSEPTAPTRSGYTFAGWSATDGGSAITFPYSPNATANITLYAKWTAVPNQGGGNNGGSGNNSGTDNNSGSTTSATSNSGVIKLKPVEVVGSTQGKVSEDQLQIKDKVVTSSGTTIITTLQVAKSDEKYTKNVKVVDNQLVIVPVEGFSGKRTITVTISEGLEVKTVEVPLVVLPEQVKAPVVIPVSNRKTTIDWKASPNADKYDVYVDDKKVCSTTKTECTIRKLIGPKTNVEIISNGGDRTKSDAAPAHYELDQAVQVVRLAGSARIKPTISATDRAGLDKVISLIKKQGFGTVIITNVTFTKSTRAASEKRLEAIKAYIDENIGKLEVDFVVQSPEKKTFINTVSLAG